MAKHDGEMIAAFMAGMGLKVQPGHKNVMVACPLAPHVKQHSRKVDRTPSMGIRVDRGAPYWCHCFTCGWGSRSLEALFVRLSELDAGYAIHLERVRDIEGADPCAGLTGYQTAPVDEDVSVVPESLWEPMAGMWHPYLGRRGITKETAQAWGTGWDEGRKRVVVPVRDKVGRLVGAVGRTLHSVVRPVYLNYWEFRKDGHLFGAHMIQPDTVLVVVEGLFDALTAWQHLDRSRYSVVAILGSHPSRRQRDLLMELGDRGVVLALDGDKAGLVGSAVAYRDLTYRTPTLVARLPDGTDPGSLGADFPPYVESALLDFPAYVCS